MDFYVQVNWLPSILLVIGSLLLLLSYPKLKKMFNNNTSLKVKQSVFGLVFIAPFTLVVGVMLAYDNYKFLTNWKRQVEECIKKSKLVEPIVVSVEKDGDTFIKLQNSINNKTVWCHHDYEKIVKFF